MVVNNAGLARAGDCVNRAARKGAEEATSTSWHFGGRGEGAPRFPTRHAHDKRHPARARRARVGCGARLTGARWRSRHQTPCPGRLRRRCRSACRHRRLWQEVPPQQGAREAPRDGAWLWGWWTAFRTGRRSRRHESWSSRFACCFRRHDCVQAHVGARREGRGAATVDRGRRWSLASPEGRLPSEWLLPRRSCPNSRGAPWPPLSRAQLRKRRGRRAEGGGTDAHRGIVSVWTLLSSWGGVRSGRRENLPRRPIVDRSETRASAARPGSVPALPACPLPHPHSPPTHKNTCKRPAWDAQP